MTFKRHYFILILCLFLAACQTGTPSSEADSKVEENEQKEENTKKKQPEETEQRPENEESEKNETNETTEEKERYYVNLENFRLYPVDESNEQKVVLLTFDDGPRGDSTGKILDILDRYNAKSLWFISGFNHAGNEEKQQRFVENVREIHERGHLIGNHTYDHHNLRERSKEEQKQDILKLNQLIKEITGKTPNYFRPPHGAYTKEQIQLTNERNMQWMNWSLGSLDWEVDTPDAVYDQVIQSIHNGANILFHDKDITAEALDDILKELSEQGYEFVLPTEVKLDQNEKDN